MNKRSRCPNWDDSERRLLREVIAPQLEVINDLSTCTNTNLAKRRAWVDVFESFNLLNAKKRSVKELKTQWKIMKRNAKIKRLKKEHQLTEDDPRPVSPPAEDREVISLTTTDFEQDCDPYDCDEDLIQKTYKKKETNETYKAQIATLTIKSINEQIEQRRIEHQQIMRHREEEHQQLLKQKEEIHLLTIELMKNKKESFMNADPRWWHESNGHHPRT